MKTFRRAAVACVALTLGCQGGSAGNRLRGEQTAAIDRLIEAQLTAQRVPGIAIAVIRRGEIVHQAAAGHADVATGTAVSVTTPFQLASTTKSFTALGVLLLVADGRVALDDRIGEHLDGLPASWEGITVRQLLSHTSGLPDIVRTPGQLDLVASDWPGAYERVADAPLQFAPGERWAYTQTNYALVARIIERRAGQGFEAFLHERIFRPLGMTDTFFPSASVSGRRCATNYERTSSAGAPPPRPLDFPPFVHGAGGLCSSLGDLIRWSLALDSGGVVATDLGHEMWTTARLTDGSPARIPGTTMGYGLGCVTDDTPGRRSVGHSGGNSSAFRRFVDDGMTIIVLHNGVSDPDGLVASIAAIVGRADGQAGPPAQERLWDAAMRGDHAEVERALLDGADIEALDTRRSRNGRRALNWAAQFNHAQVMRTLLSRGAAIDAQNSSGFTALHHAAEAGSLEAAEVLLTAGAARTVKTGAGEVPAAIARRHGHGAIAALIEAPSP